MFWEYKVANFFRFYGWIWIAVGWGILVCKKYQKMWSAVYKLVCLLKLSMVPRTWGHVPLKIFIYIMDEQLLHFIISSKLLSLHNLLAQLEDNYAWYLVFIYLMHRTLKLEHKNKVLMTSSLWSLYVPFLLISGFSEDRW